MKTALQIKMEQNELLEEARKIKGVGDTPAERKRNNRVAKQKLVRIKWLDKALAYAESNPQPDYVKQQIIMVNNKINKASEQLFHEIVINLGADPFNPEVKKKLAKAKKDSGVTKMTEQLKFLRYINS